MKKTLYLLIVLSFGSYYSQVGINTETPAVTLQVESQRQNTTISDGILAPKVGKLQLHSKSNTAYGTNQIGSLVLVDDINSTTTFNATTHPKVKKIIKTGLHYFNGNQWIPFEYPWVAMKDYNTNRSGVYLMAKATGGERGFREQFNFLDDGKSGFGTNSPSARLHLANMRDTSDTISVSTIQQKATFVVESFGGATGSTLSSYPLIRLLQARGIGSGGNIIRPTHDDSLGAIDFVAAKGNSDAVNGLTAAKIDVRFRLDNTTGGQKNTGDFIFSTSDWLLVNGTLKHSLTTRFSILGDGKIGINTQTPTTNLYVQGSYGTSTNNETASSSGSISVVDKSTIFVSVNSGNQTITLTDGVIGQRIVIINTSPTNSATISNAAGNITISPNKGTHLVYDGAKWYSLS